MCVLRPLAPVVVAACVLLAGCGKKVTYPACGGDKDCPATEKCVNKRCVQCAADSDCEAGETCEAGACVAATGCQSAADCTDQACEDGKCVACVSDDQCLEGEECREGLCIGPGECLVNEDCAEDEDCVNNRCVRADLVGQDTAGGCQLLPVYFDLDQSQVDDEARLKLEGNAQCIGQVTQRDVVVEGYTDNSGPDEYNIALSEQRARSVSEYLSRLGVDQSRMTILPRGESVATGQDEEGRAMDRKVEFRWE